jgi:purine-nucleoside phosphorylase
MIEFSDFFKKADEAAKYIEERVAMTPEVLVVLTGGMAAFVDAMEGRQTIPFSDIPHFTEARAEGHEGRVVFGILHGKRVAVMQGRFHYYEGHHPTSVVFPLFVFEKRGVRTLITTNAVGGIRQDLEPGDVMLIVDHINMMGINPLIGLAMEREEDQFTSLTAAYDPRLLKIIKRVAGNLGMSLKEGVFAAMSGPSYETKAEVRALRTLGADAVGMSTVPEVIAANFLGLKVASLSCIANAAADRHGGEMSHEEVLLAVSEAAPRMIELLNAVVGAL